jgi:uncharacterized membrane protein YdbT with pleckstrin-like domain
MVLPLILYGFLALLVGLAISSGSSPVVGWLQAAIIVFGLYETIRTTVVYFTTDLTVTDRRVILRSGLFTQRNQQIVLRKIESIDIRQAPLSSLLDFGNVTIVGTGGSTQTIKSVSRPFALRESIQTLLEG